MFDAVETAVVLNAQKQRIAELEDALKPFLDGVDEEHGNAPDDVSIDLTVTVGDCRRARRALAK